MQFAEASQEIMVKPTPMKIDSSVGLTPGRRRANQVFIAINVAILVFENKAEIKLT